MDRVPLAQVIDKEPEAKVSESVDSHQDTATESTIDEMRDMQMLSGMLGFEHGFEGADEHVKNIVQWARERTGEHSGPELLAYIKNAIRYIGTTEKGKSLVNKLRLFAALDSRQMSIQKQKELL